MKNSRNDTAISTLAKSKRGSDTKLKIIKRSIKLFNLNGIQNVTIEQIATSLEMSPGNIPYYFTTKRNLIHGAFAYFRTYFQTNIKKNEILNFSDARAFVLNGITMLWEFRFFFNSLDYLLADDKELRQGYFEFKDLAVCMVVEQIEQVVRLGYFTRPEPPNSLVTLTENMWAQWLYWLRMQQIANASLRKPDSNALYDCIFHLWALCHPYLEPHYAKTTLAELRSFLLLDGQI